MFAGAQRCFAVIIVIIVMIVMIVIIVIIVMIVMIIATSPFSDSVRRSFCWAAARSVQLWGLGFLLGLQPTNRQ